jgi:protein-S-isoprenylcysteine O-methyltransferase Ste14
MKGLILYVIFLVAGTFADVMAGLFVEYEWSSAWGLTVFLGLFFATFWFAWLLTVFVVDRAQPKAAKAVG